MDETVKFIIATVAIIALWNLTINRFGSRSPPSPAQWPVIGNYGILFKHLRNLTIHSMIAELSTKYGPLVRLSGFGRRIYIVNDASTIHHILNSPQVKRDTSIEYYTKGLFDSTLQCLQSGPLRDKHRLLMDASFDMQSIKQILQNSLSKVEETMKMWSESHGKASFEVDIQKFMSSLMLDVTGLLILSLDLSAVAATESNEMTTGQLMLERLFLFIQKRMEFFFWWWKGISSGSVFVMNTKTMMSSILKRAIRQKKIRNDHHSEQRDLLDCLLSAIKLHELAIQDEEIEGAILGLFLAATETTSMLLTYALYELCRNRRVKTKLHEELKHLKGKTLDVESLDKFEYLDQVIKETLRLHPVIPCIYRQTPDSIEALGYTIPPKSQFLIATSAVQMNSNYWSDPLSFKPERWMNNAIVPGSYLPFGDGSMSCLGQKHALIATKAILARLIATYSIELVPNQDLSEITTFVTKFKNGMHIKLQSLQ